MDLLSRIHLLNNIGISLSTEKNTDSLLEKILLGAKELTNADGGTIYLLTEARELVMAIVRTTSLNFAMGGTTGKPIPFPPIPLYHPDGTPNRNMVVTCAVLDDITINIPDAYHTTEYDFSGTYAFDKNTGYRSTSFLTIPLKNHENEIIGVLQLINAQSADGGTCAFSNESQQLAQSLASQAAVTLTNKQLIDGMKELFDAIVKMIANTIDEKSQHTGNHCRHIPILSMLIAQAVNDTQTGVFRDYSISEEELYQLETAAWLHDSGKLTTPDKVMEKATKLERPIDRIDLIRLRFEILKRDRIIQSLSGGGVEAGKALHLGDVAAAGMDAAIQALGGELAFIEKLNKGTEFVPKEDIERVAAIANNHLMEINERAESVISEDELHHLSIQKGTITDEERKVINNHIAVTIRMLESLPFPKHLRNVPEYAGGHHERVDGKGFPKGLKKDEMSVPARIMAIADIFEALTATDRPYKAPMKLSMALKIMNDMSKTGHIDPELYEVFIDKQVYMAYANRHLLPQQIDV